MCDCSEEKDDVKNVPDTVTLFQKCLKPYRPGKNIETYSVNHDLDDKNDRDQKQCLDKNSSDDICCLSKPKSLSECSSDSSRLYKFVNSQVFQEYEDGEEGEATPPFVFEPCTVSEDIQEEPDIEQTLAIIKPEATIYRRQIERRIHQEGFEICQTRWLQLTAEQASEFYKDNYGELGFAHLVAYMSSGPIIVLVLAKHKAIRDWRFLIGPTKVAEARLYFPDSIRARYGRGGEDFKNAVHGSSTMETAEREIHFFFPETILEPLPRGEALVDYFWDKINPFLTEGLTLCCKLKPADPLLWLAHWLLLNNPNKPRLPEDLALVPT